MKESNIEFGRGVKFRLLKSNLIFRLRMERVGRYLFVIRLAVQLTYYTFKLFINVSETFGKFAS